MTLPMSRFIPSLALLVLATVNVFILPLRGQEPAPLPPSTQSTEPASYDELLIRARAYSAEGSWALSREAYLSAASVAADDDARRWCALWAAEAGLHLSYRDGINPEEMSAAYTALLAPYEQGRVRDDYWLAALQMRLDAIKRRTYYARGMPKFWDEVLKIADELGKRAVTAENAVRYSQHLLRYSEGLFDRYPQYLGSLPHDRLLAHLRAASESPIPVEDRLWLKLYAAHVSARKEVSLSAIDDVLATLEHFAPDAPASATARAAALAWRGRNGRLPADADGFPNLPSWLNDIHAALAVLPPDTTHVLTQQARRDLEQLQRDWQGPRLHVTVPALYRADESIAFGIGSTFADRLHFAVHRITPSDWPEREHDGSFKSSLVPAGAERVAEWTTSLAGAPRYAWQTRFETPPEPLGPGLYALTVRGDDEKPVVRFFAVSSASAICVATDAGIEYFVYDNETGEPWPDRPVQAVYPGDPKETESASATYAVRTDAQGRTAPHRPPPAQPGRFRHLLIADGHPVWLPSQARFDGTYGSTDAELQLDLFMDRALFRPGETVNWKLIARLSQDGRLEIPKRAFTLDVVLRDESLIPQQKLEWSALGTAHGSFVIPADARPGNASLILNKENAAAGGFRPMAWTRNAVARLASDWRQAETQSRTLAFFTVDNFRTPPARLHLDLAGDPASLRPGGSATFRVRAEYFSGGPVTNTPVTFLLQAVTELHYQREPHSPELLAWKESLKARRTAITDAEGVATVHVDIPSSAPDHLPFFIVATLELNGSAAVSSNRLTSITPTGLFLEVASEDVYSHRAEQRWVLPGEKLTYRFRFVDPFGNPVNSEGETILREQQWREIWLDADGRPVAGEALHDARLRHGTGPEALSSVGWTRIMAEQVESIAASVTTVPEADGWHSASLIAPHAGVYQVEFHGRGDEIRPPLDHMENRYPRPIRLIAADEHTSSLAVPPENTFLLHRSSPSPGEPPRLLALFPEGMRHGLLSFATTERVHTRRLQGPRRIQVIDPTDATEGPLIGVARLLIPGQPYPTVVSVGSTRREHRFDTTLRKLSSEDRPGRLSEWKLTARDAEGRPVRAEIAVGVSDEALNRLHPRPGIYEPRFFANQPLEPAVAKASGQWKPGTATLEVWDPRPGLASFRTRHHAWSLPESLRSLLLIPQRIVVTTEDSRVFSSSLMGTSIRNSGPTETEKALANQPLPEGAADTASPKITVRRHFVSTAFWASQLETDANGEATFRFEYPDNLTEWRVSAYSVGHDGESFDATTTLVQSSLLFQARLLAPRLLVAGDSSALTATLVNRTDQPVLADATVSLEGALRTDNGVSPAPIRLAVPARGDAHRRWPIIANKPGDALATLRAGFDVEGDAMQVELPVLEDAFQQATSSSAYLATGRPDARLTFPLPESIARDRTHVTLHLTPNRSRAILDALPYLVDYPYGCVEQTVSRFLPAIVVRKTMTDLGLSAEEIERHVLRNEVPSAMRRRERSAGLPKLDDVVKMSLQRLEELRNDNGLYGWWGRESELDPWMSAYALLGLSFAKDQGFSVADEEFNELVDSLSAALAAAKEASSADAVALAMLISATKVDNDEGLRTRFESLYAARESLAPAGRAGLLIASKVFGTAEQRAVLLRNLENGANRVRDDAYGDTVHWGRLSGSWFPENSAVEATALTLLALQEIDPQHPDIPAAAHWLVLNRRSGHWTNTRDTALAVLALSRTLVRAADSAATQEVELLLNGQPLKRLTINRQTLLSPDLVLTLDPAALRPGENEIALRRVRGDSPLYAVALASAWTASNAVTPHGHLASADRIFVRKATRPTLLRTLEVSPTLLADGGAAIVAENVTAHVRLNFPHALSYVMIEVPKPAGFEPVNPLSAWDARLVTVATEAHPGSTDTDGPARLVYREEHDGKSVFFIRSVAAGTSELRFDLRAIHPGDYRALPVYVEAMYVPEVRANSDARRIRITE